jgi:aldehyde dehydrogenase (NAD+)
VTILKNRNSLYINGEWIAVTQLEAVLNPADESVLAEAPVGGAAHVEAGLASAREAFDKGPWPRLSQGERQAKMREFLAEIDRRSDEIIQLIIDEAGSTAMMARYVHYGMSMNVARNTVEIASRPAVTPLPVEVAPNFAGTQTLGVGVVSREPVGVVAAITPYNFPFFLNISKLVPALVVGCTVVLKPSPYTPFQALILGEIAEEVGLPKGVFSVVTGGAEVGEALTTDRRVDLVSFTGSDAVGARIQAQSAPTLKRVLLELGGKSALIVRADADIRQAAMMGISVFTVHSGQGCSLLTRQLVHNSIRKQYVEAVREIIAGLKIGDPNDPTVAIGPLIREVARERTERYVALGREQGAKLIIGGARPEGLDKGFFFQPTVFDDVDNKSRLAQEEVFGPISAVIGFDSDEEAIEIANDSEFGLSGGIFSADVGRAYEMALQLRTGGVLINGGTGGTSVHAPMGGIKRSGYGREFGLEGLNEYTYMTHIACKGG